MKALIQRVSQAEVLIENRLFAAIGRGLVVLIGIREGDDDAAAHFLAQKTVNLRIFEDDQFKMNKSAVEIGAEILAISQFTLYADCRKGRRPSFVSAARTEISLPLYKKYIDCLRQSGLSIKEGEFGAHMIVKIFNDGPVTILLDSDDK